VGLGLEEGLVGDVGLVLEVFGWCWSWGGAGDRLVMEVELCWSLGLVLEVGLE